MKVMLIRSNEREMARYRMRETNIAGIFPPLGLAHIAACLRKAGHTISILDAHAENIQSSEIVRHLPSDVEIVGFTSTSKLWPVVVESIRRLKRVFPEVFVVIGGPQVTAYPRESLQAAPAAIGVVGEGELAMLEIVSRLEKGEKYNNIPQTVVRVGEEIVIHPRSTKLLDLDNAPPPALDLLPLSRYRCVVAEKPFATMVTTRGCPYRCAFCSQLYFDRKVRMESAETVVSRMERYVRDFRVREIIIFDDVFTLNRERVMKICSLIREAGLRVRLDIRARVDNVDREMLEHLFKAGCRRIHFGIEAGTQRILDRMQKDITIDQIKKSVTAAASVGMEVRGYFILGYPGEAMKDIKTTLAFSRALPLDWVSYTLATLNPKTKLLEEALETGLVDHDFWRDYTLGEVIGPPPIFSSPGCSERSLNRMKNMGYINFYFRWRIMKRSLSTIFQRKQLCRVLGGVASGFRELIGRF